MRVFFIFPLASFVALATGSERRCPTLLRDLSVSRESIASVTGTSRQMRRHLESLVNDPLLPIAVRRVIHEAVENQRTAIAPLTASVRRAMGLAPDTRGHYDVDVTVVSETQPSVTTRYLVFANNLSRQVSAIAVRNPRVVIENSTEHATPEEVLVHELAHIRFTTFLDGNFQGMAGGGLLPEWAFVRYRRSRRFALSYAFYVYLSERYASEMQYRYVLATMDSNPRWRDEPHPVFGNVRTETAEAVRRRIAEHVRAEYPESNDPRFRQFDEMPIATILRGRYCELGTLPAP